MGNPCLLHGCHLCCVNTEMPLSERDVERLESLGYRREEFARRVGGLTVLATKEDGSCYFLDGSGRCSVYESRPEGCRLYPLVWSTETGRATLDTECPYRYEFSFGPGDVLRLMNLVREIYGKEALKGRGVLRVGRAGPKEDSRARVQGVR
ncbi:MAG: YkgJ family cysteine cluster protein [Conexivisphaera sp.]